MAVVTTLLLPVVIAAALAGGDGFQMGGDEDEGGAGGGGDAGVSAPASGAPESTDSAGGASAGDEALRDEDTGSGRLNRTSKAPTDGRVNRKVERSATLSLGVPRRDIDGVASEVGDVTASLGGFVSQSSVSSTSGGALELRVPSNRLDTAIQRLSKLGRVRDLSRRSVDITTQVVSARDRVTDARTERESLLRQLANADTVNETESIRARLEIVSQEIAAARTSLKRVNNRANFADVSVALVPRTGGDSDDGGAWTPGDAFGDALRVLEVAAGVAVIVAALLLPLLIAWLLGWLVRRGVTRRGRERALDMA
jgi:Domain of unknown function (DUF4349)